MPVKWCFSATVLAAALGLAASSALASVTLFGGPTYDSATGTGFQYPVLPYNPGSTSGDGTAVGYVRKFGVGTNLGYRAVRWDASGTGAIELGNLGTGSSGFTESSAFAVNSAGTAVGFAQKYSSGGLSLGLRAARWTASGTAATELGHLGTNSGGSTSSYAYAINTAGTAVGYAAKHHSSGADLGTRAVRWDASGTVATELGNIGTVGSFGFTSSSAYAISSAGTAVGYAEKYNTSNTFIGTRAVRWDESGTAATELDNIGTTSSGLTRSRAYAVNTAGTAVGYAETYNSGNTYLGTRAVRWDASGTAATELDNLGTTVSGSTNCYAYAINTVGAAIGYAEKYNSGGTSLGTRAVRWDASGTVVTELGNLGTYSFGITGSAAYAINADGTAVGYAAKYNSGNTFLGNRAVAWESDGVAIDLNTLLSPADAALWTLTEARGISDTGWITGIGSFDPDGAGGSLAAYNRAFLIQIPAPGVASLLGLGGVVAARRRRVV